MSKAYWHPFSKSHRNFSMKSFQKCAVCSQAADKSCSGCKNVYYCSLNHQKEDWKRHKNSCAPYSVSTKDGVKVLILRRNVPQGTILLDETSIFHVPESNGIKVDSICLVCGLHMISATDSRCSICTWPVCGLNCEAVWSKCVDLVELFQFRCFFFSIRCTGTTNARFLRPVNSDTNRIC